MIDLKKIHDNVEYPLVKLRCGGIVGIHEIGTLKTNNSDQVTYCVRFTGSEDWYYYDAQGCYYESNGECKWGPPFDIEGIVENHEVEDEGSERT
jgi:hypothetical protein